MRLIKTVDTSFDSVELNDVNGVVLVDKNSVDFIKEITTNLSTKVLTSAAEFGKQLVKEVLTGK